MATKLTPEKILARETATTYRGRPLILELHPGYLTLREKGRRARVTLGYAAAFETAWKILARQQQLEKSATKKRRKR